MTGMPSFSLVLDERRRNPYSNEYSMIYSSAGHTIKVTGEKKEKGEPHKRQCGKSM
jgi:hypothetical protein